MMTVLSLIYMSPNAQVSPNRQSRAIAPMTQDLLGETKRNKRNKRIGFSSTKGGTHLQGGKALSVVSAKRVYQNGIFVFKLDAVCKSSSLRKYTEMEML